MKYSRSTINAYLAGALAGALLSLLAAAPLHAQSRKCTPVADAAHTGDTLYWLDVAPFTLPVTLGPREANKEVTVPCRLQAVEPNRNLYQIVIDRPKEGFTYVTMKVVCGGAMASDEFALRVEHPRLRAPQGAGDAPANGSAVDGWSGLHAVVGELYDPSSEWANIAIPASHYQTVVRIKGREVLNSPGVTFHDVTGSARDAMTITEDITPDDIITRVYWKPGGTADPARWVLLLSNQPDPKAVIPLGARRMDVELARPASATSER